MGGVENIEDCMVVSQNRGTPIWTPNTIVLIMGTPKKGTPNFGKPPYEPRGGGYPGCVSPGSPTSEAAV